MQDCIECPLTCFALIVTCSDLPLLMTWRRHGSQAGFRNTQNLPQNMALQI